jgi:hypothetical protein
MNQMLEKTKIKKQEKEKLLHRNNIYSRQFLTPSRSHGNLGYASISAGNSVNSLVAPTFSTSGLSQKSKSMLSHIQHAGKCDMHTSSKS